MTLVPSGGHEALPKLGYEPNDPYLYSQQLHGQVYDDAVALIATLETRVTGIMAEANALSDRLNYKLWGEQGLIHEVVSTPEGGVLKPLELPEPITDEAEYFELQERHNALGDTIENGQQMIAQLRAHMWQETGTRLFKEWASGLDPQTAIDRFYKFYNTNSPDDFYSACGVTSEGVKALFVNAARRVAPEYQAIRFAPDSEQGRQLERLKQLAQFLDVNPAFVGIKD